MPKSHNLTHRAFKWTSEVKNGVQTQMGTQVHWSSCVNSCPTLRSLIKAQFHGKSTGCRPSCMLPADGHCLQGKEELGQTSSPCGSESAPGPGLTANAKRRPQGQDRHRMMTPSWDTCLALSLTVASQGQNHKPQICQNPRNSHVSTKNTAEGVSL